MNAQHTHIHIHTHTRTRARTYACTYVRRERERESIDINNINSTPNPNKHSQIRKQVRTKWQLKKHLPVYLSQMMTTSSSISMATDPGSKTLHQIINYVSQLTPDNKYTPMILRRTSRILSKPLGTHLLVPADDSTVTWPCLVGSRSHDPIFMMFT